MFCSNNRRYIVVALSIWVHRRRVSGSRISLNPAFQLSVCIYANVASSPSFTRSMEYSIVFSPRQILFIVLLYRKFRLCITSASSKIHTSKIARTQGFLREGGFLIAHYNTNRQRKQVLCRSFCVCKISVKNNREDRADIFQFIILIERGANPQDLRWRMHHPSSCDRRLPDRWLSFWCRLPL